MKKVLAVIVLTLVCAFAFGGTALAYDPYEDEFVFIEHNGYDTDYVGYVFDDTTFLPLRDVAEMMGWFVDWSPYTGYIVADNGRGVQIRMREDESIAYQRDSGDIGWKGSQMYWMEYAPFCVDGVTYLPLRDCCQLLRCLVDYEKRWTDFYFDGEYCWDYIGFVNIIDSYYYY